MSILHKSGGAVAAAALIAIAVAAWAAIGPGRLGGPASYHRIAGMSMEPRLHAGDLVAVRDVREYAVGDVVAYRSPDLGAVVLHRIVARDGARFVMQGDANSWTDSYHPRGDELMGRQVLRVPRAGAALATVQRHRTLLTAVALTLLGLSFGAARGPQLARAATRRRRASARGGSTRAARSAGAAGTSQSLRQTWQALASVLMVALIAAGTLAVLAYSRPLQRAATTSLPYEQRGAFSYSGAASRAGVYDGDAALTGQPVFTRVAPAVALRFDYLLDAPAGATAVGTIALLAELSDEQGWRRALVLQPARAFDGASATAAGNVSFAQLNALIDEVERATGVRRGYYRLTVRAEVHTLAAVGGASVEERFTPAIAFRLEPLELTLETRMGADGRDPLTPTTVGAASIETLRGARLSLPWMTLDVAAARRIALATGALSALALAATLALTRSADQHTPRAIERWHGDRLVAVAVATPAAAGGALIEVEHFADLLRIAHTEGALILHANEYGVHTYVVAGERVSYRFRSAAGAEALNAPAAGGIARADELG